MSYQQVIQLLKNLPESYQQEILHYIEFIVQKAEKEKRPKDQSLKRKGFGSLKGKIWMAPDFDEPLEDFKEYM